MQVAPTRCASSTRCLTMIGRDIAESSGYLFSYRAFALSALLRNSPTYSSRTSLTTDSTAPMSSALRRTVSRSWRSWPTSIASATTSMSWLSRIHWMATEVSRPPEYARTHLALAMWVPPWLGGLRQKRSVLKEPYGRPRYFWMVSATAAASAALLVMIKMVSSPAIDPR